MNREEYPLGHLLRNREEVDDLLPVEARKTVFNVDLDCPDKPVLHRLGDMLYGRVRTSVAGAELVGMQTGDHLEDAQHKILKGLVLRTELHGCPAIIPIRTFWNIADPDLLRRPGPRVQSSRNHRNQSFWEMSVRPQTAAGQMGRGEMGGM